MRLSKKILISLACHFLPREHQYGYHMPTRLSLYLPITAPLLECSSWTSGSLTHSWAFQVQLQSHPFSAPPTITVDGQSHSMTALWTTSSSLLSGFLSSAYSQNLARSLLLKNPHICMAWHLLGSPPSVIASVYSSWPRKWFYPQPSLPPSWTQRILSKIKRKRKKEKPNSLLHNEFQDILGYTQRKLSPELKKGLVFSTPLLPWQCPNTFTSLQGIQWLQMVGTTGIFEENYL